MNRILLKPIGLQSRGLALPSISFFMIISVLFACVVKGSDHMLKNIEMIFGLLDSILNLCCIFDMGRNALLTNAL